MSLSVLPKDNSLESFSNENRLQKIEPIHEQKSQSSDIALLAQGLAKVQSSLNNAEKSSLNPFFKSNYADLSTVWAVCRKPLTDNGFAVIQTVEPMGHNYNLITTLVHSSGQWIKSVSPILYAKNDSQAFGSALTYAKRYALSAIVGVCQGEVDDDGEKSMSRGSTVSLSTQTQNPVNLSTADCQPLEKITEEFINEDELKQLDFYLKHPDDKKLFLGFASHYCKTSDGTFKALPRSKVEGILKHSKTRFESRAKELSVEVIQ